MSRHSNASIDEDKKTALDVEHVEASREPVEVVNGLAFQPSGAPPQDRWYSRFLKQPPSGQFLKDVHAANQEELDRKVSRRVVRKLDCLIMPALFVCYAFYYVDKTTLSYGAIFNLQKNLHLKATEYSWLSSLFYWGWLAWAVPTNLLMQKFPLSKYLAANIFMWGALLMCQAAAKNFASLAVLRILSGAFEATADPAFVLITSTWYTRAEQPTRIGMWYSANGFGIAFGGLLGYGIGHITERLKPWQWEFIIIGLMCSLWAIALWVLIPDQPDRAWRFTPEQRVVIQSRKRGDQQGADSRAWRRDQAVEALMDPKTYLFFLFGLTANIPNGGTSNFGTLIVKGFGFDTFQTTLMQIPYGMFIAIVIFVCVFLNSKAPKNTRTILMALVTVPTVVGFAMIAFISQKGKIARLIGYWLTGSSNAVFVLGLSLVSGNVSGQTKKALASAAVFLGVAVGNIIGPFFFFDSEAPGYRTGVIVCMVSRAAEIVVILALRFVFLRANAKRDRELAEGRVKYDENEVLGDVTDWQNRAFRYVA